MKTAEPVAIELAQIWARLYHARGYNPLPARQIAGRTRPAAKRYTKLRDNGIGESVLDKWWSPSVQVATGVCWDLCVVDLDGLAARQVWAAFCRYRTMEPTWTVEHDPKGGMHLWYRLPAGWEELPHKTVLWHHPTRKHAAIELLGDNNLIVAPPSIHPRSELPYHFLDGRSPHELDRPAEIPLWVLELARKQALAAVRLRARKLATNTVGSAVWEPHPLGPRPTQGDYVSLDRVHWREVIDAIPDKVALAASWGLRFVNDFPNAAGWIHCRAYDREDVRPSAMFHVATGSYWEPSLGAISLFVLGIALGMYPDYRTAIKSLAYDFLSPRGSHHAAH
jgi:hypothetical protein